jgi:hypothetical protein
LHRWAILQAAAPSAVWRGGAIARQRSMIPKSGFRFSEKIMLK